MTANIRTIVAAAGLGCVAASVNAQEISTSTAVGIESEYIFRGVDLAGESVQASVDVTYGNGYVGIWTNEPLQKEYDSEIDVYAGYQYLINDELTADFGATLYYYPDQEVGDDETVELYAGISANTVAASPSLYFFYDFDLEVFTTEASASQSFDVTEKAAVEVGAAAGWAREDAGADYIYYNVTADFVYKISETMQGSIGARLGGNDSGLGARGKDDHAWAGFSFSADF